MKYLKPESPCGGFKIWALSLLFLIGGGSGLLSAQTAWSLNPDAPTSPSYNIQLKYANQAFRLFSRSGINYNDAFKITNLNATPEISMPYSLVVNPQTLGANSAPSSDTKLTIRYATSSGQYEAVVLDGSTLTIPSPSHTLVGPSQAVAGFVVVSATYGTTTNFTDVKNSFRTKAVAIPSYSSWTQWNDFTYDGTGALLLFADGSRETLAYPNASGIYQTTDPGSYGFFSFGKKSCGAYGQGKLVMGFSGDFHSYSRSQPLIHTPSPGNYSSYDWTSPLITEGFQVEQIIYEAGKFMAVGSRKDSNYTSVSKGAVLLSQDGVEWTTVVIPGTTSLEAVCYNNGQWVAVGDSGSVLTSMNGYEWVKTTIPAAGKLISVAGGNGYCAVGSSAGTIYTTRDFGSWADQIRSSGPVSSLAVGDGRFMALVGNQVYHSAFSPAGIVDIISQPENAFIVPQQAVNLSVAAEGTAQVSYQWYQGTSGNVSLPIVGAVDSSYQTPPLAMTKSYWVRVSNGIGSEDSFTATLTMQVPPVIIAQPTSKTLAMGSSISTTINVAGNNIAYQWYQGYSGDLSKPITNKTSASFDLPSLLPGVSYYWVRVGNDLNTLDSATIRAEVTAVLPTIVDEPLDSTTYQTVFSSINVKANGPSLNYQWYGGVRGDTSHPISGNSSSIYPPDNLVGTYQFWVRITNPVGFVDSRTALFSVVGSLAPVITAQPFDTATHLGSSKSVSVNVDGESLNYSWYGGESGDTSVLLDDSGSSFDPSSNSVGIYRYWVRISNAAGFVNSIAITYSVKPLGVGLISHQPLSISTQVGNSFYLSVTSTSPSSTYQWYSGLSGNTSGLLPGATSATYYSSSTTAGQRAYWVRVTSGTIVENSETAVVTVIPSIFTISGRLVSRSTYVDDSVSYYVNTRGLNVTHQWYLGVSGDTSRPLLNETSNYFSPPVTVAGVNRYWMRARSGTAYLDSLSSTLTVIGRPPVITVQPQNQVFNLGSGSISLTADADNSTGVTWQWYKGNSGNTAYPLFGKTSPTLSITNPLTGNLAYWVRAMNPYGSAYSSTATVTVNPTLYTDWLVQNGLPGSGTGMGAFNASPNQDGASNLMKYALGMKLSERFDTLHGPQMGSVNLGGSTYLTLKFVQSQTAQSVQLLVEESTNLSNWTTTAIEYAPSYDSGDGKRTHTFRHSQPMTSEVTGFLRLKATSN